MSEHANRLVGEIIFTASEKIPWYCLFADGSTISRSTYSELFAEIGERYGAGDGTTTFQIPNMLQRVPMGINTANAATDTMGETAAIGSATNVGFYIILMPLIVWASAHKRQQ
jgi:microcystin-dependent protein